jgi:uncharacterized protein
MIQSTLPELKRIEAMVDLDLSSYGGPHFKRHSEMILQEGTKVIQYISSGTGGHIRINVKENGSAHLTIDSKELQIEMRDYTFFLESNFVGFEWIYVMLNFKNEELKSWLFHVNSLQNLPYLVKRVNEKKLETNLGAELILGNDGHISEFRYPTQGLTVRLEDIPEPDWNAKIQSLGRERPFYQISNNAKFLLEEIRIDGPIAEIAGAFRIPKRAGPYPAVLFISGSGPQDRHGFSGELDLGTHDILDHLANNGVLVLSYDDRDTGESRSKNNGNEVGLHDLISDSTMALEKLIERPDVLKDRIYIMGHSEGAIIAMILSLTIRCAGIILMAPPFRSFDNILEEQIIKYLKGSHYTSVQISAQLSEFQRFIKYVRENRPLDFESPPLLLTNYRSAKWLREHFSLRLSEIASKVKCPVLIFFGDKDFQLDAIKDGRMLEKTFIASGNSNVTFHLLKDCDHLFRIEEKESRPSRYFEIDRPISSQFLDWLVDWIFHVNRSSSD